MNSTRMTLRSLTCRKDRFILLAEFVPLPGQRLENIEAFLREYPEKKNQIPADMVLGGITLPQSPSGVASLSPADIYCLLDREDLWADLDVVCHVTAKDHNVDAVKSYLLGLQKLSIQSVLALTGDKPAESEGVFEVDSIGLIDLIQEMNQQAFQQARPGHFDAVANFFVGAAVSPFKYTEASLRQQYYKMRKKLRAGADFLITQMGWDWRKSEELFRYLDQEHLGPPVFGNVYLLSTLTPAPRLMVEGKLPGCVVTQDLFARLQRESPAEHIARAAQQVAMYRDLGAAGVDLGGLLQFDMLVEIAQRAEEIGPNWRAYAENLDFGIERGYYLYDGSGQSRPASQPPASWSKRTFDFMHDAFLEPGQGLHDSLAAGFGRHRGMQQGDGRLYKLFFAGFETPVKRLLFDCQQCGDCYLVENFGICSLGKCEKGLDNPPCGDANPDGTCGSNAERRCVGELIWEAAASEGAAGLQALQTRIHAKRDSRLANTSSIVNYLLGRDHMKKVDLIQIGESLHASIPRTGAAMRELREKGPQAYEQPSGALEYILSLIHGQVRHRADYLAVNVDAFGEDDPQLAVDLMRQYVRLVLRHGRGVPVCVDSSSDDVLKAGLDEWYRSAPSETAWPLINSIKTYTMDEMLPLRARHPFKFIGLLVDEKSSGSDGAYAADDLHAMARRIYHRAVEHHGFAPDDILFDSTVFPLAIDMPMTPNTPGYTYRAFEAIRRIMQDPEMAGVHTSLGISNCVRDLPARSIGVCRAYLAKAMEYGLDAAIVNVTHDYGLKPVAPDLLELVDAFARQDGAPPRTQKAMEAMGQFCRLNRKARS
ncbi:MAG: methylenetetrahydrofolate reductase C-terminal domain-containing protein [Sedimentisphaerales bacterium]|nr:methylenetetrahydrofolate reductase C-terminal domain-containing protein [Sedimentisphaerales bacterium]